MIFSGTSESYCTLTVVWLSEAGRPHQDLPHTSFHPCFFSKCHSKSALGLQADLRLLVKGHIALTGEGLHLNYTDVMRPGCAYKVAPSKNTRGSTASRDCGSAYGLARPASGPGWADGIWQLYTLLVMLVAVITCSHAGRECHVACSQGFED